MPQKFTNQAKAALAGNITVGATSLAVNAGLADLFPVANTVNWVTPLDWFKALIVDNAGQVEVIKVGTRAAGSGAFTNVQRAQDGTTAKAFTAGSAWVVHGPMASDFAQALAGIFAQFTATNGVVGAAWRINAGILTLSQTDAAGNILADRFTFDQTNGTMTVVDLAFSSDERLKSGWKRMPRFFLQRMVDEVKRGIYRRKGTKRLEAGVGAQSLRAIAPWWVHADAKGELSVSYAQAGLVTALEVADSHLELVAEVADLRERLARLERRK